MRNDVVYPSRPRPRAHTVQLPPPALMLLAATLVMSAGALVPVPALRVALTLPVALVAPGYALLAALFGTWRRFDPGPAAAACVMLSMAVYALLMLALYVAAVPLSLTSLLVGTDGLILLLAVLAEARERKAAGTAWLPAAPRVAAGERSPWHGARAGALLGAILAGVIAALVIAMVLLPKPVDQPYTQLYLSGTSAHVSGIVTVQPHQMLTLEVGVANKTHRTQTYRIAPAVDNSASWPARTLTLSPGQIWAGAVRGGVPAGGCVHRVAISLYGASGHKVLRDLVVWARTASPRTATCQG
jgi:uncharacterized membrane protein